MLSKYKGDLPLEGRKPLNLRAMPWMEPTSQPKTMVGGCQNEKLLWDFMEEHLWQRHSPGFPLFYYICPGRHIPGFTLFHYVHPGRYNLGFTLFYYVQVNTTLGLPLFYYVCPGRHSPGLTLFYYVYPSRHSSGFILFYYVQTDTTLGSPC